MTELLLVRHASCDVTDKVLTGRSPGVHLSDIGIRQAAVLAERLSELPIAAVYASPLERALETAKPLAERIGVPVRAAPGLTELDFGWWTGRSVESLASDPVWERFNRERGSTRIPGGEVMDQVVARATAELGRIAAEHGGHRVVAVSHGDVIRGALAHYAGMPLDRMLRLEVSPASVSVLRCGGEWMVTAINWRAGGLGDADSRP
jgi:probable phosphomutase (TIGR03848 family)